MIEVSDRESAISLELVTDRRGVSILYVYRDGVFLSQATGRIETLKYFAATEYPGAKLHELKLGEAAA